MTTHDRRCISAPSPRVSRPARTWQAALLYIPVSLGVCSSLGSSLGLALIGSAGCGQVRLPGNDDGDGIDAGSGASDAMEPAPPRLASSFEMNVELTYTATFPLPPDFLPREHAFVLQIADDGATAGAIAGVAGEAVAGSFSRLVNGELVLAGEIMLPSGSNTFLCGSDQVVYEEMTLESFDDDGDGAPDRVQGTATGTFNGFGLGGNVFTAVLTGSRDITPPELTLLGSSTNRSVLGDLVVLASEPLQPGLSVTAVSASGKRLPLEPRLGGGSILSFVSPDDVLLPFGETVQLEVQPAIEDLAGNSGALATPTFQTLTEPQDFPQDGFESDGNVALSGNATRVAAVGSASAIAGTTSLLLEPGSSATLRIPLQGAASGSLTLQVRGLFPEQADRNIGGEVVLASPASPAYVHLPFPRASGETVATGDANWAFAGNTTLLNIPLPEGTADELIVVLRMPTSSCNDDEQAPAANAAVLIDSVTFLDAAQPASAAARR